MPEHHEQKIRDKISKLQNGITDREDVKIIQINGETLFRQKIGSRSNEVDYRAIFDIVDSEIKIITIIHRDKGYNRLKI